MQEISFGPFLALSGLPSRYPQMLDHMMTSSSAHPFTLVIKRVPFVVYGNGSVASKPNHWRAYGSAAAQVSGTCAYTQQAAPLTQPQYGQSIPQQQQNQNEMGQLLLMIREHSQTMSNMQSQMVQLNNSC